MSDPARRRVAVPGGELAVTEAGDPDAPSVLLLAGGLTSAHVWRALIPLLAPWMHVLAPDLLGSGDSAAGPDADLGLAGHVRAVRALLEDAGVERLAILGHGHGGGVAQLLALEVEVEALSLIGAIAFDAWPSPRVAELSAAIDAGEAVDPVAGMRATIVHGMSHPERLSEADLEGYLRPFRGPGGAERFARAVASFDGRGLVGLEPRLATLEIPTFLLWGEDDAFVDVVVAERLGDALPRASIAVLPGCGHFLLEDAGETVIPLLFQWLRRQYLREEHQHDVGGPVTVTLGRRPPGEGG